MKSIFRKDVHILFKAVSYSFLLLFLLIGFNRINGQDTKNQILLSKIYEIDSVTIRARIESRNLMEKPYTEPNSLVPSISKISHDDIVDRGQPISLRH